LQRTPQSLNNITPVSNFLCGISYAIVAAPVIPRLTIDIVITWVITNCIIRVNKTIESKDHRYYGREHHSSHSCCPYYHKQR
jgi:hypothetical protein